MFKQFIISLLVIIFLLNLPISIIQSQNTLPMPPTENYDQILGEKNRIKQIIDIETSGTNGYGTENILRQMMSSSYGIVTTINILIGTIALFMLVMIGVNFVISNGDTDKMNAQKKQFGYLLIGLFIVSLSEFVALNIFDPNWGFLQNKNTLVVLNNKAMQIKSYLQYMIGFITLFMATLSGYNIIVSGNNDDTISKEKSFILNILIGGVLIIVAEIFVRFVFVGQVFNEAGEIVRNDGLNAERGIMELIGILNYILTFSGAIAIFMIILSGAYYVFSMGDEDRMNRAKRIIINSIIALVIIFSSYTISTFLTT